MATSRKTNTNREIQRTESWIRLFAPLLEDAKEAIVLGLGDGLHILALQSKYPGLAITVVDPSAKQLLNATLAATPTIRYLETKKGVSTLRLALRATAHPIPILCHRPSWINHNVFFEETLTTLTDREAFDQWYGTPAEFILESLFV